LIASVAEVSCGFVSFYVNSRQYSSEGVSLIDISRGQLVVAGAQLR